jgi:hypothetical protein
MASFTDENGIFWADPDDVGYGPGSNPPKTTPIQRVIDSFAGIPCQWRRPDDATVAPGQICGLIHDRCTGHFHARTDKEERIPLKGNPCGGVARLGATICRLHAPSGNARRAAERNHRAEQAAKLVGKLAGSTGVPVEDPASALALLAGEMREFNAAAREEVSKLESILVVSGDRIDLHPLVALLERSHTRLERTYNGMVKLGLVEQRLQLEESKLAVVERALVAVFVRHGLDPDVGRRELAEQLLTLDALDATGRELEAGAGS